MELRQNIVVFTGAGISKESGIPTFRDINYAHHEVPKFLIDPSDMDGRLPVGFMHIKASAVQGVDVLLEELEKL